MKLKVICQRCGKTEIIETDDLPYEWELVSPRQFGIKADYDLWFCLECSKKKMEVIK